MDIMKFKEFPKDRTLKLIIFITFIPFIVITILFCINEVELELTTGYGLLDFELAGTPGMVNTIFAAWGPLQMQKQTTMMYLDLFYPFCYGLFGWGCVLFMSRKLEGKLLEFGLKVSLATLIAGIFDELENINLLLMLQSGMATDTIIPLLATIFASLKIGFILGGLSFLYITFIHWIIRKYNKSKKYLYSALIGGGILVICLLTIWNFFFSVPFGMLYFVLVALSVKMS